MYQRLNGPIPQPCNLIAMKLGSEAKAAAMVADRQDTMSATLTIPGYDVSVASASQALAGIAVLASLKDLYVEVVLDGYGSDVDSAAPGGGEIPAGVAGEGPVMRVVARPWRALLAPDFAGVDHG